MDEHSVAVAEVAIRIAILILGIVGNVVAISVILILKDHLHSVTHWYALQLAIADTIFLLTLPFRLSEIFNQDHWIHPEWLCKAKETILYLNYYSSIFFLMVMSIDRYIAVCRKFSTKLQQLRKRHSAYIISSVVWIISLLISIPAMIASGVDGYYPLCHCKFNLKKLNPGYCQETNSSCSTSNAPICTRNEIASVSGYSGDDFSSDDDPVFNYTDDYASKEHSTSGDFIVFTRKIPYGEVDVRCYYDDKVGREFRYYMYFNFIAMYIVPLLVMFPCYGLIVYRLTQTKVAASTPQGCQNTVTTRKKSSSSVSERIRTQVTVMCAILVSSFVLCWLPFHAVHLAKMRAINGTEGSTCITLGVLGSLLAYLNSALNPYLYSFLGSNFYQRWRKAGTKVKRTIFRQQTSGSVFNFGNFDRMKRNRTSSASTRKSVRSCSPAECSDRVKEGKVAKNETSRSH